MLTDGLGAYASDATEVAGLSATPDAVVCPRTTDEVRLAVEWAHSQRIPLVPRGGGTGFSGGAVASTGGVVVDLSRMDRVLSFDPELWRIHVEAGVLTATLQRLARENGLRFPPDPGAAEQSQIGGNIATNAGGPHAFKYGVTGQWVTGLEAVVAPGEVIRLGGAVRKDVAAYDLMGLLIGSEGTLGIITSAWLRLIPAPEAELPNRRELCRSAAGCEAIMRLSVVRGDPVRDRIPRCRHARGGGGSFPAPLDPDARFLVITEADGS